MIKKLFLLFFFIAGTIKAQTLNGIIQDSKSKVPLPFSNLVLLNTKIGAYSNDSGHFDFTINLNSNDTLKISSIGYESLFVPLKDLTNIKKVEFNLKQKTYFLDEIIINTKKIKYSKKYKLGKNRIGNVSVSSLVGLEYCIYIDNPFQTSGLLKSVFVNLKKRDNENFISPLKIKIYKYDKINNIPGEELLIENLIIVAKNKKYVLDVDVRDYKIPFLKDGICIGVEWLDPNNETNKFDKIGPTLRYTYIDDNSISWTNYHNRGWKNGIVKYRNNEKAIPLINIEVLMIK